MGSQASSNTVEGTNPAPLESAAGVPTAVTANWGVAELSRFTCMVLVTRKLAGRKLATRGAGAWFCTFGVTFCALLHAVSKLPMTSNDPSSGSSCLSTVLVQGPTAMPSYVRWFGAGVGQSPVPGCATISALIIRNTSRAGSD